MDTMPASRSSSRTGTCRNPPAVIHTMISLTVMALVQRCRSSFDQDAHRARRCQTRRAAHDVPLGHDASNARCAQSITTKAPIRRSAITLAAVARLAVGPMVATSPTLRDKIALTVVPYSPPRHCPKYLLVSSCSRRAASCGWQPLSKSAGGRPKCLI